MRDFFLHRNLNLMRNVNYNFIFTMDLRVVVHLEIKNIILVNMITLNIGYHENFYFSVCVGKTSYWVTS